MHPYTNEIRMYLTEVRDKLSEIPGLKAGTSHELREAASNPGRPSP